MTASLTVPATAVSPVDRFLVFRRGRDGRDDHLHQTVLRRGLEPRDRSRQPREHDVARDRLGGDARAAAAEAGGGGDCRRGDLIGRSISRGKGGSPLDPHQSPPIRYGDRFLAPGIADAHVLEGGAREGSARCRRIAEQRPLLMTALTGDEAALARLLREEEDGEREADRQYWAPLRRRLEALRREHHERR